MEDIARYHAAGARIEIWFQDGEAPRDSWLSNLEFSPSDDIVKQCCDVWNKLIAQPWKIISIGRHQWAHRC